jgi:hypothetical protein
VRLKVSILRLTPPKLYVVTVYKVFGIFLGSLVIREDKLNGSEKVTV